MSGTRSSNHPITGFVGTCGRLTVLAFTGLIAATGCGASAGSGEGRAEVVFNDNCGVCHGGAGEGKAEIEAPAIAGLPAWYVEAQLNKFRAGTRGAHADDLAGLRMRPMSRSIDEGDVPTVSAYVASLSPAAPDHTITGDVEAGKTLYAGCAACHGQDGKGMEALKAPPVAQLDDWYLAEQIHKFKAGERGADPADVEGAMMAPMAKVLKDDAAVADVIAYINTLGG